MCPGWLKWQLGSDWVKRAEEGSPGVKDLLTLTPCDIFPYIRDRTLWLIGDSLTLVPPPALLWIMTNAHECGCFSVFKRNGKTEEWCKSNLAWANKDAMRRQDAQCLLLLHQSFLASLGAQGRTANGLCRKSAAESAVAESWKWKEGITSFWILSAWYHKTSRWRPRCCWHRI